MASYSPAATWQASLTLITAPQKQRDWLSGICVASLQHAFCIPRCAGAKKARHLRRAAKLGRKHRLKRGDQHGKRFARLECG